MRYQEVTSRWRSDRRASGQATDKLIPTDQVEQALRQAPVDQLSAEERIDYLVRAGEVAHGRLPVEALEAFNAHAGTDSYDLTDGSGGGPDGDQDDVVTRFDFDGDGRPEPVTENELQTEVGNRANTTAAGEAMAELEKLQYAADNPKELPDFEGTLEEMGYRIDHDWWSSEEVYNGQDNEVSYEISRDRAEWVITVNDPDLDGPVEGRIPGAVEDASE